MFFSNVLLLILISILPRIVDGVDPPEPVIDENYDSRVKHPQCAQFLDQVGRSSYACGDCYAHASAQMLGTALCITPLDVPARPTVPLSCYDGITCANLDANPCQGQHWRGVEAIFGRGAPTGTNVPGETGGCKPYRFPLCDRKKKPMPDICPNKDDEKERFKRRDCVCLRTADRRDKCEDGSGEQFLLYGRGSRLIELKSTSSTYMKDIQLAIMSNGTVAAGYFAGKKFKELGKRKDFPILTKQEDDFKGKENHVILLAGWGTEVDSKGKRTDYWLVKSPNLGIQFGTNGYCRIKRGINLNNIETSIYAIWLKEREPESCNPRPHVETQYIEVDGVKTKCKSREGSRCPPSCASTSSETRYLDFACAGNLATALPTDVDLACDSEDKKHGDL